MRFFRGISVEADLRNRDRLQQDAGFNAVFSFLASHTPPSNTSASPHSVGQQSSWELKWCLKNNLLILIRPVGRQAKTSWVSSSLCCQQPDDKQSSYCVEKRRALTSRQAGGIKPAMIKGPFSKSLADLHGRTLWSRLKDWKWRWRKWRRTIWGGGGDYFSCLRATAGEIRCVWSSLKEEGLNSFNLPLSTKKT